jgi:hypothetical protein
MVPVSFAHAFIDTIAASVVKPAMEAQGCPFLEIADQTRHMVDDHNANLRLKLRLEISSPRHSLFLPISVLSWLRDGKGQAMGFYSINNKLHAITKFY